MKRSLPIQSINKQVKVYGYTTANHKHPLWFSVMEKRRVTGHAVGVVLKDAFFEVNKSEEKRCREGIKRKNGSWLRKPYTKSPYAFVCGQLIQVVNTEAEIFPDFETSEFVKMKFFRNDWKDGYFGTLTGMSISQASYIILCPNNFIAYL